MQTLKTIVVIGVLAIVGYGLYIGLNNGFEFAEPPPTPDWLKKETTDVPAPPNIEFGPPPGSDPAGPRVDLGTPDAPGTQNPNYNPVPPADTSAIPEARYPDHPMSQANNLAPPAVAGSDTRTVTPGATSPPGTVAGMSYEVPANESAHATTFKSTLASARQQLNRGQLASALLQLSVWYDDTKLSAADQRDLVTLLDQVAGTVIYSREHLIEPAYRATGAEKLEDVAKQFNVPAGLLAKINGIPSSGPLAAGQELKVVRGPFNAVIDTEKGVLTLWVGGRYAGRFMANVGPEFDQIVGTFTVQDKQRVHAANSGNAWIQLGTGYPPASAGTTGAQLGIAGSPNPAQPATPGQIRVTTQDADDLIDIFSTGSRVTIRR